jgi:acetate kinase
MAGPRVLVVNAGSSSLKLSAVVPDDDGPSTTIDDWDGSDVDPIAAFVADAGRVDAVGHRVVHGGPHLRWPVVLHDDVVKQLGELVTLAPLHQPRSLAGIAAAVEAVPDVPHVACFDTAYHSTLAPSVSTYAVPDEWRTRWPIRRYGFHGLSHAYAARMAASQLDRSDDPGFRVVTCHLGSGASLCASRGGRSVDTTMGFTPLEGLVMGTRSGTIDPGLVLWLISEGGLSADEVHDGLEHRSGLQGLAGTADMREVLSRSDDGDHDAALAVDLYVTSIVRHAVGMVATLGGLDALAFTGGVGENTPKIRDQVVERLAFLGEVPTLTIPAREDLEIARGVAEALAGRGS